MAKQCGEAGVEEIARTYGFRELRVERELTGGMFARPVVIQTDRGRFVQRLHRFRDTESAFQFQAEVVNGASTLGVMCPRVVRTCEGDWCVAVANGVVAVHEYIEGSCDGWHEWQRRKQHQPGFLRDLGLLVAKLHNALAGVLPGGDARLDHRLPPIQFVQLERIRAAWQSEMRDLKASNSLNGRLAREAMLSFETRIDNHWDALIGNFSRCALSDLRSQIVHGDISPVNIVFTPTGDMAFIDWDCVHLGHRVYDALGDVLNRSPHDREGPADFSVDEVSEYLAGYDSQIAEPLTAQERRSVPAFCLARQLEDLRQRLRVTSDLDTSQDEIHARLIAMRVETMDQIELN